MAPRFEYFDPSSAELPYLPYFEVAHAIRWRACVLLKQRSRKDVVEIAHDAEAIIDVFFDSEQDRLKSKIREEGRFDLYEDGEHQSSGIRAEAYDEYDIRDKDNTSNLEALVDALDWVFDPSTINAQNVREYEVLAAFALSKLDDWVRQCEFHFDLKARTYVRRGARELSSFDYRSAAGDLFEALDAVGRGELLKAKEDLSNDYGRRLDELHEAKVLTVETNVRLITEKIRTEFIERDARSRKDQALALNNIRHEQNRQTKSRVLEAFAKDPLRFSSAEKAAKHFCAELSEEGIEREQRTVADWIRGYAKQAGIKWRA